MLFCAAAMFERTYVVPKEGRTLIVGSRIFSERPDRRALYRDAIGVDMIDGDGVDVVYNLERKTAPKKLGRFAHIECLSVLEHSKRPWVMAANIEDMLEPYGTLFVSVPFVWRVHGYPHDYWRMTIDGLRTIFPRIDWKDRLKYGTVGYLTDNFLTKQVSGVMEDGSPIYPRTEVYGFGERK